MCLQCVWPLCPLALGAAARTAAEPCSRSVLGPEGAGLSRRSCIPAPARQCERSSPAMMGRRSARFPPSVKLPGLASHTRKRHQHGAWSMALAGPRLSVRFPDAAVSSAWSRRLSTAPQRWAAVSGQLSPVPGGPCAAETRGHR